MNQSPSSTTEMPVDFAKALSSAEWAEVAFAMLAPIQQSKYIAWIEQAKLPATRARRIRTTIAMIHEWHVHLS